MSTPLSNAYAQVIRERGYEAGFLKKLGAFMKSRGHLPLFPEIARILERDPKKNGARVLLAREKDEKKYAKEIREALKTIGEDDAETVIDPNAVGGYAVIGATKAVDRSFRSALVTIYQRTTGTHHD